MKNAKDLTPSTDPPLLEFNKDGKTASFDLINGRWTFQPEGVEVGEAAQVFFDELERMFCNTWKQYLLACLPNEQSICTNSAYQEGWNACLAEIKKNAGL